MATRRNISKVGTGAGPHSDLERILGYDVQDRNGNSIGKVSAIWVDDEGRPAFVGVQTSWLLGKSHVAPSQGVDVNYRSKLLKLPYSQDTVKDAPSFDGQPVLSPENIDDIYDYYSTRGMEGRPQEVAESKAAAEEPVTGKRVTPEEERVVGLHEEQLKIGKRRVQAGGVRLHKIVRTEMVEQPLELSREDVIIERTPPSVEDKLSAEGAFEEQDIYIPLWREEPVIEKEVVLREEVHAHKKAETLRENVRGDVRKEDIRIDEDRPELHP